MATMLTIARNIDLPEGAELKLIKELRSEYRLRLSWAGQEAVVHIRKECTPGHARKLIRACLATGFISCCLDANDLTQAKNWNGVIIDPSQKNWPVKNGQLMFTT